MQIRYQISTNPAGSRPIQASASSEESRGQQRVNTAIQELTHLESIKSTIIGTVSGLVIHRFVKNPLASAALNFALAPTISLFTRPVGQIDIQTLKQEFLHSIPYAVAVPVSMSLLSGLLFKNANSRAAQVLLFCAEEIFSTAINFGVNYFSTESNQRGDLGSEITVAGLQQLHGLVMHVGMT